MRAIERDHQPLRVDVAGRSTDSWAVWFDRVHVICAIITVCLAVGSWLAGIGTARAATVDALLIVLAVWTWLCLFRTPRFGIVRPAVFLALALPLYIALGVAWPTTMTLLFLGYWQMYALLELKPAIVVSAVLTVANIWAQEGFPARFPIDSAAEFGFLLAAVGFGGLFAWFIGATISQSIERQELIDELRRTQVDLAASERRQGMLAERQRMAGDVHDTIAQEFTSILMSLEAARTRLSTRPDEAETYLELARNAARNGLGESRRIIQAMRPELLAGRSLQEALETLTTRWSRQTGILTSFTLDGDPLEIGRDQEIAVFRSLQESLTNIRKHASANRVDVSLGFLGDEVILDVRDDGTGFAPDHVQTGVGLETMRERARQLGGRLDVETAPGEGVALSFALPAGTEERR